jgi:hypothetical protein
MIDKPAPSRPGANQCNANQLQAMGTASKITGGAPVVVAMDRAGAGKGRLSIQRWAWLPPRSR